MGRFCFSPRILEFPQIWGNFVKKKTRFSLFFNRINRKPNRKNLWISSLYVTWFSWVTWGFSHSFFYDKNPFEKNPFPQIWRNSLQLKFFISPNLGKFPQIWGQPDCQWKFPSFFFLTPSLTQSYYYYYYYWTFISVSCQLSIHIQNS